MLDKITKPTFIVSRKRVRSNIDKMLGKIRGTTTQLTPHFKTHQNVEVSEIYRDMGITRITVSSVDMAIQFANAGWNDILIAFPVNTRQVDDINDLASKIDLHLFVDSVTSVQLLQENLKFALDIMLEIDTGYGRTGLNAGSWDKVKQLIELIETSELTRFEGLYTHAGHSYTSDREKKLAIFESSKQQMLHLKQQIKALGHDTLLCYGDTPSCSLAKKGDFEGFDYISPGNFTYYDLMQFSFGSCGKDQIAVMLACPVVGKYGDGKIAIHGGGVHFSKDRLDIEGTTYWGVLAGHNNDYCWAAEFSGNNYLASISQDHGIVQVTAELYEEVEIGDLLYFYPVHSCMAADLMKEHTIIIDK